MAKSSNSKLVKVLGFVVVTVSCFSLKKHSQKQSLKILNRMLAQIQFHKAGLFTLIMKLWLQDG